MKLNFIKIFFSRIIAKQLRRPSGLLAAGVGNEMNKANSSLYESTITTMQVSDNESILEIGFGNGHFFDKLFSCADNLKISGLDFSDEMVKLATINNASTINTGKLSLRAGSSDKIPFPDQSFEKVFCINVVYFWEQPSDHLKEICRVLKPGGKLYTTIRTKESMVSMPFTKYGFTIYTEGEWCDVLGKNDFHFVRTDKTQDETGKETSLCIVAKKQLNTLTKNNQH